MSKQYHWAQSLGVSQADLDAWSKQVDSSEILVSWCIRTNKIDEAQYMNWARNYYGLPILKSNFFQNGFNEPFFRSLESMAFWSKELLPVCEWDGVLFLACAEPLSDTPWSFPVQFLLASPKDLEAKWNQVSGNIAVHSETAPQVFEQSEIARR